MRNKNKNLLGESYKQILLAMSVLLLSSIVTPHIAANSLTVKSTLKSSAQQGSNALVAELMASGQGAYRNGQYHNAIDRFRHAQHLLHQQFGVETLEQKTVIDWMIRTHVAMNNFKAADAEHSLNFKIHANAYGTTHKAMIKPIWEMADWYQFTARHRQAKTVYQQALDLAQEQGLDSLSTAEILLDKVVNDYLQNQCCSKKELSQIQGLIAESSITPSSITASGQDAALNNERYAFISKRFAQLQVIAGRYRDATAYYQHESPSSSGKALGLIGVSAPRRMSRAYLEIYTEDPRNKRYITANHNWLSPGKLRGAPLPFCEVRLSELINQNKKEDKLSELKLAFELAVDKKGRVEKIALLESNAPILVQRLVRKIIRLSRFDPAVDDKLRTVRFEQNFSEEAEILPAAVHLPETNLAAFQSCHQIEANLASLR